MRMCPGQSCATASKGLPTDHLRPALGFSRAPTLVRQARGDVVLSKTQLRLASRTSGAGCSMAPQAPGVSLCSTALQMGASEPAHHEVFEHAGTVNVVVCARTIQAQHCGSGVHFAAAAERFGCSLRPSPACRGQIVMAGTLRRMRRESFCASVFATNQPLEWCCA